LAKNLRVRLLAAATVNGKRSYFKPAMRSTGWPDPAAVLVRDRKVRIAPTQLHSYYVTWFEGKKQKWKNVGSDALTAWQCKLNREAIMNGAAGAEEQKVKHNGNRVTVTDAIEVFLEDVKAGKSPKTHQARQRMLDLFTESCSKQYLDQVNEADCQQFIRFLRKRYNSAKGARTVYNVFQGFNTFLRANKIFIAGQLLKALDYDEKIVDAYTREELKALKKACSADEWLVWEYFWWSGCREGEVAHAEWRDLDFRKNVLHVQPKPNRDWKVKDKEDRFVPLPPALVKKLQDRKGKAEQHDLIFPAENGGVEGHFLRRLQNFVEDHKVKGTWELHKFRKTFATFYHEEQGVSVRTLQTWLGHSDLETTMAYLKGSDAASERSQAQVAKAYEAFAD
jgi:integrase